MELEYMPKWRLYMLLPIIGVGAAVAFVIMKLRHTGPDTTDNGLEMTNERRRMLIEAERLDNIARGEEI